ncbi:MAG: hypothetical protein ACFFCP_13930 [Promethearchaeota archaeon]
MKSIPIFSTIGINMDLERWNLIVPATATRRLQLAGGQPMEQAVPEDYVLAGMTMRALEQRNGHDLEFILKCYLPVAIIQSPFQNRSFLVELFGLTSESLTCHKNFNASTLIEEIDSGSLLDAIKHARALISPFRKTNRTTLLGLMSGLMSRGVTQILERPLGNSIENYSITLTGLLGQKEFARSIESLRETADVLSSVEDSIISLVDAISGMVEATVGNQENVSAPILSRLELRISSLEKQILDLESELKMINASNIEQKKVRMSELKKTIESRRSALERDREHKNRLLSETQETSRDLLMERDGFLAEAQSAKESIHDQLVYLKDLSVPISGENAGDAGTLIMLPFFLAGFSKKGQLQIEIYTVSQMTSNGDKVSRRRDFVDGFETPTRAIGAVASLLGERANNDVALRKFIRDSSKRYNLLAVKESRSAILEGGQFLLGDGLIKQSLLDELKSIISGFPESQVKPRKRRLTVAAEGSLCKVRFHIQSETGHPVENAELDLGVLQAKSDSKGMITVSLPLSTYEGSVTAPGYFEKPLEFTITSTSDVAIPIIINSLSHEDQLSVRLDELVDRSRRLDSIRERLLEVFEKQGSTLLGIPAYRTALVELLSELGYEPESWIAEANVKSGMVRRLLKRDDRTDGLRRDILRIAADSKQFGGIMLFSELLVRLDEYGWGTNPDEIEEIVGEMTKEGLIQGLSTIEGGALMVEFVPVALTDDPQQILSLAAKKDGRLSIEDAVVNLSWTEERVKNALELLMSNGVVKEQKSYSKSTQYWFPGLRREKK